MAITTYNELKTRAITYVNRDQNLIDDDVIDDLMSNVEAIIWAKIRVPEMVSFLSFTYAAGGESLDNFDSGDLIEVQSVNVSLTATNNPTLPPVDEGQLRVLISSNTNTNVPAAFGWLSQVSGTSAKLAIGPEPTGQTVALAYYRQFGTIVTAVNAVFTAYPIVWLYTLLAEMYYYLLNIEQGQLWDARADKAIGAAVSLGRNRLNLSFRGGQASPLDTMGFRP